MFGNRGMAVGSKSKVQSYTYRARNARTIEEKLNAIASAIDEVADFIDDLENQLRRIESRIR
jgi:hypothetical protein